MTYRRGGGGLEGNPEGSQGTLRGERTVPGAAGAAPAGGSGGAPAGAPEGPGEAQPALRARSSMACSSTSPALASTASRAGEWASGSAPGPPSA